MYLKSYYLAKSVVYAKVVYPLTISYESTFRKPKPKLLGPLTTLKYFTKANSTFDYD